MNSLTVDVSGQTSSKLKFSVERILSSEPSNGNVNAEGLTRIREEPPCAGCVAALYRCCRDEPPLLPLPLSMSYTHLHPALRPTTGMILIFNKWLGICFLSCS